MSLSDPEVDRALRARRSAWRRRGQALVREMRMRDFDSAMQVLERVGADAADYERRPDMCILTPNRVRLTIVNPHHAGITRAELRLASRVDSVLENLSPQPSWRARQASWRSRRSSALSGSTSSSENAWLMR
jgi:pterin-4a-carbinolamine dehydratase